MCSGMTTHLEHNYKKREWNMNISNHSEFFEKKGPLTFLSLDSVNKIETWLN